MSEPKFTPGPWNVAGFDSRINEERYFGIDTPRGQMIVESRGECDLNREANGYLIAAAPKMYKKLGEMQKLCLEMAEYWSDNDIKHDYFEDRATEIDLLLNNARGEE